MKRAAIYLRQSVDNAEGIERQREKCTSLVDLRNWELVASFEDNEVRASRERGSGTAWDRMLSEVGRRFDVIVAVDLDRLLRSTRDLHTLVDLRASVVTVDGEIDLSTADGEFRATMLAGIARFEVKRAGERIRRAQQQRRESGKWHGGTPPYGYRAENGSLVQSGSEAAHVQEAARRVLLGDSLASIVGVWNRSGIATRSGKHWRQTNLRHVLMNRSTLGETKAGARMADPLISADDFDELQRIFKDPTRKITHSPGVNAVSNSLGGGVTVCGLCGKGMTSHKKQGADGSRTRAALACLARVNGPDPVNHPRDSRGREQFRVTVDHDRLEEFVFDTVAASLQTNPRWGQKLSEADPDAKAHVAALRTEQGRLLEKQRKLHDSYIEGLIDEDYHRSTVSSLNIEREKNQREIDAILGQPALSDAVADVINWRRWSALNRRKFLKLMGLRVEIGPWPEGVSKNLPRHRGETDAELAERRAAHLRSVIEQRATIVV